MADEITKGIGKVASGAATGASIGGPYGAIAGAAVGLGSAIIGGVNSANENRQRTRRLQEDKEDLRRWYEMTKNMDYTQRLQAKAVMNEQRDLMRKQTNQVRATNVVAGGTEESESAQKQIYNQGVHEVARDLSVQGEAQRESQMREIRNEIAQKDAQLYNESVNKSQNIANATGKAVESAENLINVAGSAIGTIKNGQTGESVPASPSVDYGKVAQAFTSVAEQQQKEMLAKPIKKIV